MMNTSEVEAQLPPPTNFDVTSVILLTQAPERESLSTHPAALARLMSRKWH
jgi:hypothetical protein